MHQSAAQLRNPAEPHLSVAKMRCNGSSTAAVQKCQLMAELNAQRCSMQSQQAQSAGPVEQHKQLQQQPHKKLQGLQLALQLFVHEAEQVP